MADHESHPPREWGSELPADLAGALSEVMAGADRFGHRQHLHLAWLALETYPADADDVLVAWLLELGRHHGTPERFNLTRTQAWLKLIRRHWAGDNRTGGFGGFVRRHSRLLDSSLLDRHWSAAAIASEEARLGWLEPDLLPLPAG